MLNVVERFTSINGEGPRSGELARFIRFRGCNLDCSYCDTAWANQEDCPAEEMTPEALAIETAQTGIANVTLTGGEPLLQPGIQTLIRLLMEQGQTVEVETNGSVSLRCLQPLRACGPGRLSLTMDYKLPGSGMESKMLRDNLALLTRTDTLKLVAGSLEDLERAKELLVHHPLVETTQVFLSPVHGTLPLTAYVDFLRTHRLNGVKFQLQLHKIVWHPEARGV